MFHGHTHYQLVWRFTEDSNLEKLADRTISANSGDTFVVGVGSVGEPEGGQQTSYVIYDNETQTIELMSI